MSDLIRLGPLFLWTSHVDPETFGHKSIGMLVLEKLQVSEGSFATGFAKMVAEFVLEDSAEPAAY
jgi:hypothetical protein